MLPVARALNTLALIFYVNDGVHSNRTHLFPGQLPGYFLGNDMLFLTPHLFHFRRLDSGIAR